MRIPLWLLIVNLVSISGAFAGDVDFDKLARREKEQLAACMSDTMAVIEKHRLGTKTVSIWNLFESACGVEIERVKSATESQLKDELLKKLLPGQTIFGMISNASDILEKGRLSPCAADGCSVDRYRACLMQQMPSAIRARKKPADFEKQAQEQCEGAEGMTRSILSNDFDNVQKHHFAGGLDHRMNDTIGSIILATRQAVVVIYAEDLVKVQPGRKSCKPEMCGASACISLGGDQPTEYQCVIDQK